MPVYCFMPDHLHLILHGKGCFRSTPRERTPVPPIADDIECIRREVCKGSK